jgi:hypothetical protein
MSEADTNKVSKEDRISTKKEDLTLRHKIFDWIPEEASLICLVKGGKKGQG